MSEILSETTIDPIKIEGTEFICELPPGLGKVTALGMERGKVVAHTESGVRIILPSKPPPEGGKL